LIDLHAHRRALLFLASVLEIPVLHRAALRLGKRPEVVATTVDGVAVEEVRPADEAPVPTFVFFTGAHPLRRREPLVRQVTHGLARVGYQVFLPELPGLGEGEISLRTLQAAVTVTRAAAERPEVAGGRVSLLGASAGASIALLAAADPELVDRVSLVVAVAPFADLEKMVCLATAGAYEEPAGRFEAYAADDLLLRVVTRSLIALLPAPDRALLRAELGPLEAEDPSELDRLRQRAGALTREGHALLELLANRDATRFRDLCADLPREMVDTLRQLSPIHAAPSVHAPVEIVVPPRDVYFPPGEAAALAQALPLARLTTTGTLDHTRPSTSLRRLRELRDFYDFAVRSLALSATDTRPRRSGS
jgi:pimeloyl-ACP methyl ester carboxylesterase